MSLVDVIARFAELRILIVGDVMIDAYIWGEHTRMSPEAPVPVVDVQRREARLGGAANVALNIKGAGAEALILTVLGARGRAKEYVRLMEEEELRTDGLLMSDERICTVKTRVISNEKHMMRVDEEDSSYLSTADENALRVRFNDVISQERIDAVILQDYNKGVLTPGLIRDVIDRCRSKDIPTMVDPKKDNFMEYIGATLFKPNLKELREGLANGDIAVDRTSLDVAIEALQQRMPHGKSLITLSEHGVYWNSGSESAVIPVFEREIVDVSGAGDTVISLATLALAAGADLPQAALLADLGGGMVCEQVGVQPIDQEDLKRECQSLNL